MFGVPKKIFNLCQRFAAQVKMSSSKDSESEVSSDNAPTERRNRTMNELNKMRMEGSLCTVRFDLNGKLIDAHKNILVAGSPYFRAMFCGNFEESKSKGLEEPIVLKEIDSEAFETVLKFMYVDQLDLTTGNVTQVLAAAHLLQLTDAVDLCEKFMVDEASVSTYLQFRIAAETYDLKDFLQLDFFQENFVALSKTQPFKELDKQMLCTLTKDMLYYSGDEIEVFRAAVDWLEHAQDRQQHLHDVMACVRFPLIPVEVLSEEVLGHDMIRLDGFVYKRVRDALTSQVKPISGKESAFEERCMVWVENGERENGFCVGTPLRMHAMPAASVLDGTFQTRSFPAPPIGMLINDSIQLCQANDNLYLLGTNQETFTLIVQIYNATTKKWVFVGDSKKKGRSDTTVAHVDGKIIIAGGMLVTKDSDFKFNGSLNTSEVVEFDPQKKCWREVAPLPIPVCAASSCVRQGSMYVAGGYYDEGTCDQFFEFSVERNTWHRREPLKEARMEYLLETVGGEIFAIDSLTWIQ